MASCITCVNTGAESNIFRNKSKSRETLANFISFSGFRHVVDLIKHRKIKNLRVSFGGVSPSFVDVVDLSTELGVAASG